MGIVAEDAPVTQGAPAPSLWSQLGEGVSTALGWYERIAEIDREREGAESNTRALTELQEERVNPSFSNVAAKTVSENPWPWIAGGIGIVGVIILAVR